MKIINILIAFVIFTALSLFAMPAMAREDKAAHSRNVPRMPAMRQGPTDPAEMEAFLDDLMSREMEENHVVGAAVSVVKDGKLFFSKGYGHADLENKVTVNPEQTIFRIGSVGKVFTWTAVMQLVEQGYLDLDADVNTYLDFRIPDTYPQPITLKHLMTHTAGFEDLYFETLTLNADQQLPVGEWLGTHIPARVRPPGECAAYSNYSANLAGYIVARVSGQTYEGYIQEHIFDPLGMTRSTALWIIPPGLRAHESAGYFYADGTFQPVPNEDDYSGQPAMIPAGGHASSVIDMARFMSAHLQGGFYGDASTEMRILEERTARQMLSTLYTPDQHLTGTAYGFFDFSDNGQWTLGHSGSTLGYNTLLLLLPDQNLGIFVAYNAEEVGDLTRQHFGFQRAFFDHYYPASAIESIQPPADFVERADRFVGAYTWTRSASTTIEKYSTQLFGPPIGIKNPGDGTLFMSTPYGDWRLVEVEPLYFRQADGPFYFVFREDAQGRITYMFTDMIPQFAFEKAQWYETVGFNLPLLMTSLLMFLSMLPVALIRALRNRRTRGDQISTVVGARVAYWLIVGISILNLLFVIGSALWGEQLRFGVPLTYKIVLGLGVLSALLTVGALAYSALAWKDRYWSTAFRVYYTLVTVSAVAFVWFMNQWNLLGWRY